MRTFILAGLIIFTHSFYGLILSGQDNNDNSYQIKQIKTKKGWYIFYAVKNDTLFKIVSEKIKHKDQNCNTIEVGKYYKLVLHSNIPEINGVKLMPINYLDVKTMYSPGQSVFSIEPKKGIFDTFHADNIKGRCFIE
jgi:hypothetical protein